MWGTLPADSFNSFVSQYFNENSLKYNLNYVQKETADFDRDLVEALASKSGPDAIILPEDLIVRYSNKVYPIPYTTLSELQFKNTFIQEGELFLKQDGIMALPFTIDPLVMYWNRDIFNNAGITKVPTTWAEISALVSKMTKKDQNKNILSSAVALGEYRNINNAKEILSAIFLQLGNPIISVDSSGNYVGVFKQDFGLNTSPASLALGFYTNFSNPSKAEYSWNRSLPNSLNAFTNGDLAIYFGFASEYLKIKEKNPNLSFAVAVMPQTAQAKVYSTFGNMLGFAILNGSSDPAGAYAVITSLTSAKAFPYWSDIFNLPSARRDILGQAEQSAVKQVFNTSAILSKGWFDPDYNQTSTIFQDMVESYTTGRESLSDVVTTASDRLDKLLK
jgi:ABC-type glycerol-3-phosphate transport system substrate-binding protein